MAKILSEQEILHLARLGALARLRELDEEARAIRGMFPGLKPEPERTADAEKRPRKTNGRKGKSRMSPEARQAAAERMKAYWARRKGLTPEPADAPAEGSETAAEVSPKPRGRKAAGRKARGRKRR